MALHGFYSAYANQRFQPGTSPDMVQFFNHEAWIEDDAVAFELDGMIKKGAVPHISRINADDLSAAAEKAAAEAEAFRRKAALAKAATVVTGTTTTTTMGAIVADSLSAVIQPATVSSKK